MFNLTEANATLDNLNLRAEKHGEDTVPAADLKVSMQVANTALDVFDAALRGAFWRKPGAGEQAELLDDDHVTVLRFPKIKTVKYEHEIKGCSVKIGYGIGGDSDIGLDGCEADKFELEPLEGGTVGMSFRIKARPTGEQVAKLYELIQDDIVISITPPAPGAINGDSTGDAS